ncbi:hypothetical protein CRYUN_Cryun01aG0251500 [Craigia yunnanensis]
MKHIFLNSSPCLVWVGSVGFEKGDDKGIFIYCFDQHLVIQRRCYINLATNSFFSWQYPKEPPLIYLKGSKGLDEQRQTHLISNIRDKACELPSCFMLVALCEVTTVFECIIRWWNWLQIENKNNAKNLFSATVHLRNTGSQQEAVEESMGNCPVCRKVFHAKDFEHVLDLVGSHSSQLSLDETEVKDDERLLHSDLENIRRQKFEVIYKLQQEKSGLIGSKTDHVVLPGINPQNTVTSSNHASTKETIEQPQIDPAATSETNSSSSSTRPATSKLSGMRRQRAQNSRKHSRQWVRKDNGGAAD